MKIAEYIIKSLPEKYRAMLVYILLQHFDIKLITPYLRGRLIIITPSRRLVSLLQTSNYHELSEVQFVKRFVSPAMIILDIGANIGY